MYLEDQRVGWSHERVDEQDQPPTITTRTRIEITFNRGAVALSASLTNTFVETADGRPIESRNEQEMGLMKVVKVTRFKPDGVEVVTRQGGHEVRHQLPTPKTADGSAWLTPAAVRRHIRNEIAGDAQAIEYWTIDPATGMNPIKVSMKRRGQEDVEVLGKHVPATAWDTTTSALPGIIGREYTGRAGSTRQVFVELHAGHGDDGRTSGPGTSDREGGPRSN